MRSGPQAGPRVRAQGSRRAPASAEGARLLAFSPFLGINHMLCWKFDTVEFLECFSYSPMLL